MAKADDKNLDMLDRVNRNEVDKKNKQIDIGNTDDADMINVDKYRINIENISKF